MACFPMTHVWKEVAWPRITAIVGSTGIGMWICGKVEYTDLRRDEIRGGFFMFLFLFLPELLASH